MSVAFFPKTTEIWNQSLKRVNSSLAIPLLIPLLLLCMIMYPASISGGRGMWQGGYGLLHNDYLCKSIYVLHGCGRVIHSVVCGRFCGLCVFFHSLVPLLILTVDVSSRSVCSLSFTFTLLLAGSPQMNDLCFRTLHYPDRVTTENLLEGIFWERCIQGTSLLVWRERSLLLMLVSSTFVLKILSGWLNRGSEAEWENSVLYVYT